MNTVKVSFVLDIEQQRYSNGMYWPRIDLAKFPTGNVVGRSFSTKLHYYFRASTGDSIYTFEIPKHIFETQARYSLNCVHKYIDLEYEIDSNGRYTDLYINKIENGITYYYVRSTESIRAGATPAYQYSDDGSTWIPLNGTKLLEGILTGKHTKKKVDYREFLKNRKVDRAVKKKVVDHQALYAANPDHYLTTQQAEDFNGTLRLLERKSKLIVIGSSKYPKEQGIFQAFVVGGPTISGDKSRFFVFRFKSNAKWEMTRVDYDVVLEIASNIKLVLKDTKSMTPIASTPSVKVCLKWLLHVAVSSAVNR